MENSKMEALEKLDALLHEMSEKEIEDVIYLLSNHAEISHTQQS